jgi:hypothetical protein
MTPGRRLVAVCVASAAAALASAAPALAQSGRPILPPHPTADHLPYGSSDCPTGDPACIAGTVAEMYRRINSVVPVCDHRAAFALAYLRVTEEWQRRIAAGFFADAEWTARIDRVFASLYFDAYDAERRDLVPPAWLLALDYARNRQSNALGNFIAEFSAHVNRDLVFALAKVGLTRPDGTSHKPDYDRGNDIVLALASPVLSEIVERFDPTTDDLAFFPIQQTVVQSFLAWRERTWRMAELLVGASTPEARAAVVAQVERQAVIEGQLALATQRYRDASGAAERDRWCAERGGQRPGAYAPGAAALRLARGRITVRGARARIRMACPGPSLGCKGTIALRRGRRILGRRAYELAAGKVKTVPVRVARGLRGRAVVRLTRRGVPAPGAVASMPVQLRPASR